MTANSERDPTKIITSPKGLALAPFLNTPDATYNPDGEFKVTLVLDPGDETKAFAAKLVAANEQSVVMAKKEHPDKMIKAAYPSLAREAEDGKVYVAFKLKALVTPRNGNPFAQKPALFDAKGNPMTKDISDGSVIRVAFEAVPFDTTAIGAGIVLRLKAVQVLSLVEPAALGSFRSFGFVQEEGYVEDGLPAK